MRNIEEVQYGTGPVEGVEPDCKYQGQNDDLLDLDIVHLCPLLPWARGVKKLARTLHLYGQGDVLFLPVIKNNADKNTSNITISQTIRALLQFSIFALLFENI